MVSNTGLDDDTESEDVGVVGVAGGTKSVVVNFGAVRRHLDAVTSNADLICFTDCVFEGAFSFVVGEES